MTILDKAFDLREETIARRRDFHQNPELAFNEVRTAQIVAQELRDLGLEVTTGVAKTGVIGLLHGAAETPVLGLRFDMDALPIQEETGAPYASVVPGKMHACGHDCHTAVGLSVAKLLAAHKDELQGTIKFIFQPAEEMDGGAAHMIAEGALENPSLDYIMGFHVWNELPIGSYGLVPGPMMAASEIFNVKISGKGGHGAQPHATRDPILAAAHVITALQSIVSRNVDPLDTAVVSVCQVEAGTANNIIPQEALLTGTLRAFKMEYLSAAIHLENGNNIESRFFFTQLLPDICISTHTNFISFCFVYGLPRLSIDIAVSGFYFHKNEVRCIFHYEIQLES